MPLHLFPSTTTGEPSRRVSGTLVGRREFLAGLALCASGLTTGCARHAGSKGYADGWYVWVSDTHVSADRSAVLHGQNMADNWKAVVADILDADDQPRGLLIDGDLALHDGRPGDYHTLLETASPLLKSGIPLHSVLGNHDDRGNIRAALDVSGKSLGSPLANKRVGTVEASKLRYLLLDSQDGVNVTRGVLGKDQLDWLARDLDARPETPTIVFVHHNLNARSSSSLQDTTALLDAIRPRRQVKAVVFGHTHVFHVATQDGLHLINLPAVGYKFLPKQPLGWCVFRPADDGGELELRCVGRDRRKHGERRWLPWRSV